MSVEVVRSVTHEVTRVIHEQENWLESLGIQIQAVILFGSVQHGNIKPDGSSDVDLYFLAEDDGFPNFVQGISTIIGGRWGRYFFVKVPKFAENLGLSEVNYRVASYNRALDSLDRLVGLLADKRPLNEVITFRSKGKNKTATLEEALREATWVYQVFKTGQVIRGEIPRRIKRKLKEVDQAMEELRKRIIAEKGSR